MRPKHLRSYGLLWGTCMSLVLLVGTASNMAGARTSGGHSAFSCATCHTPGTDNPNVQIWNAQQVSGQLTEYYRSPTMHAKGSPPDGASKMCLSCHDGTNSDVNSNHRFGTGSRMGSLENSHPVSFVYDTALVMADGHLVDPSRLPQEVLDVNGKMQCTSCHDVHNTNRNQRNYLRWPYNASVPSTTTQFCRQCHDR